MNAIIEFFSSIGDFLATVVDFAISFFKDLIFAIQLIAKFISQIPSFFSWLPGEILTLIIALFAIVAIYKILGREG